MSTIQLTTSKNLIHTLLNSIGSNMAPINTTTNQQAAMTQNVSPSSDTIAIAFGTITAVLAILAIIIAWKQYRKRQHMPQLPNFTFTIEPLASSYAPSRNVETRIVPGQPNSCKSSPIEMVLCTAPHTDECRVE